MWRALLLLGLFLASASCATLGPREPLCGPLTRRTWADVASTSMTTRAICKTCHERPVPPSRERKSTFICSRCFHRSPGGRVRLARYNATAARKAVQQDHNRRRIMIGGMYHSAARTADDARRINAHIKRMVAGFEFSQREASQA